MPAIYLTYTLGDGETMQASIVADGDRPDLLDDMVARVNEAFSQQLIDVVDIVHTPDGIDDDSEDIEPDAFIVQTMNADELNELLMINGNEEDEQ